MEKQLCLILDSGHGGLIQTENGLYYPTAPKKMYDHGENGIAYEGEHTRRVCAEIIKRWSAMQKPFIYLSSNLDISLTDRVNLANAAYEDVMDKFNCLYLSVHLNAGKGTGMEVYTSPGQTKSDLYADIIAEELIKERPDIKFRPDKISDGDYDKEDKFYVLVETVMPAVLVELCFFDRLEDWNYIKTAKYPIDMAEAIVSALLRSEKEIN